MAVANQRVASRRKRKYVNMFKVRQLARMTFVEGF